MTTQDRFLRLPEVLLLTGLSKAQIYLLISCRNFPRQIKLGERASAWLESEVRAWMDCKIAESNQAHGGKAA